VSLIFKIALANKFSMLSFLGKAYMHIRFRNREKVQKELDKKYEGQFKNAGTMLLADIFMALATVIVISIIAVLLYAIV
jgi:hypothetical protein